MPNHDHPVVFVDHLLVQVRTRVTIGELIRPHLATAQQRSAPADFPRDHPEPAGQPAGPSAATRPPQRDVWDPPDALSM